MWYKDSVVTPSYLNLLDWSKFEVNKRIKTNANIRVNYARVNFLRVKGYTA